ncbi:unnamed protein product [Mytilus edulis]|uniref:Uncharacterized protein n=1 Tax=Mytilus edulis TaxID=6550 RepID=A0A8S3Q164_MYTED|nr:unnamed protein product [Mytilus edulis]
MFTKYCIYNEIRILETAENERVRLVSDQTSSVVGREELDEILQADPLLGFPQCCRIFSEKRKLENYTNCIISLLYGPDENVGLTLYIIKKVNPTWLNIDAILVECLERNHTDIIEWILQNVDPDLFDEDLLFLKINESYFNADKEENDGKPKYECIVEMLLKTSRVKHSDPKKTCRSSNSQ